MPQLALDGPAGLPQPQLAGAHTLQWLIRCGVSLEPRRALPSKDRDYVSLKEDLNHCRQTGLAHPEHVGDGWHC